MPGGWISTLRLGPPSRLASVWTAALTGCALSARALEPGPFVSLALAVSLAFCGGPWLAVSLGVFGLESSASRSPGGWAALPLGLILVGLIVVLGSEEDGPAAPWLAGFCRCLLYLLPAYCIGGALAGPAVVVALQAACYAGGLRGAARGRLDSPWPLALMGFPIAFTASELARAPGAAALWVGAAGWTAFFLRELLRGERERALAGLSAGFCLFDALWLSLAGAWWPASLAALAFCPLSMLLQRRAILR